MKADEDTSIVVLIEEENGKVYYMNGELVPEDELKEMERSTTRTIIVDNIEEDEGEVVW